MAMTADSRWRKEAFIILFVFGQVGMNGDTFAIKAPKDFRADFREGVEDSNFHFPESGGSLNRPDLFTELPFL